MDIFDIAELAAVLLTALFGAALYMFPSKMLGKEYRNDEKAVNDYRRKGSVLFIAGAFCSITLLILKLIG